MGRLRAAIGHDLGVDLGTANTLILLRGRGVQIGAEPLAAAIGAGVPVDEPRGSMVVDIGGGTTEVAVLVLGSILASTSLRVAGDAMDAAIVSYIRKHHGVLIGERTAEKIKQNAASAWPGVRDVNADIVGRDLATGRPKRVKLSADELREGIAEPIDDISDAVVSVFDRLPPEIVRDIARSGVVLTGGGALLAGIDRRLSRDVGVVVTVDPEPLTCVVRGAGILLDRPIRGPRRGPGRSLRA